MKASQCTLKSVVALSGKVSPLKRGIIVGPVSTHPSLGEVVIVEWYDNNIQKITTRSLLTEYEADQFDEKTLAAEAKLESEWSAVEAKVRAKVDAAAKLIGEAGKMANEVDRVLAGMDIGSSLENAMKSAGWNTSSWSC
jgi:hypothetical protein